jgi:mannose-1-phosphate guanylyltransferase
MLINTTLHEEGSAILKISGGLVRSSDLHGLGDSCRQLAAQGRRCILIDLGASGRVNMAGLAALVELAALNAELHLAYCALPAPALRKLKASGLDRGLALFDTAEEALASPEFRRNSLRNARAVLLCAGRGSRIAPLSDVTPKPMLDIAGRPVLDRIMAHLGSFGIRDILLNPGHLGPQITGHFQQNRPGGTSLFFVNEGSMSSGSWQARPIGSASTLKRMQSRHTAFAEPFFVLCGDALIDLDLAAMMETHRSSGADVTIAAQTVAPQDTHKYGMIETTRRGRITQFLEKPAPGQTDSQLANTGIYILSPRVLDLIPDQDGLDIGSDLLPLVLGAGRHMQVHDAPFSWTDIGCGRDYAHASAQALSGALPDVVPEGREVRPGLWCGAGAQISPRARIEGPCHVGPGARIGPGVRLKGPCSVGAGAVIEPNCVLENCFVLPDTHIARGVWGQHLVLHAEWSFDHRYADGSARNTTPLDGVGPLPEADEKQLKTLA